MKRLFHSPLSVLALLTILLGVTITLMTAGYLIGLGLILIGAGLVAYLVDYLTNRFVKEKKAFRAIQYLLVTGYFMLTFVSYMKFQEHNTIVFPKGFKGQAGIIFGMEGYPKLPKTQFWKKTIYIPPSGIIITSTQPEELPNIVQYSFSDGAPADYNRINWDPNFEMDCITSNSKIKSWLFQVADEQNPVVKDTITALCERIAANQERSFYKNNNSVIWSDDRGSYLWLQNKGLTSLPSGLGNTNIYKAILTGNNFKQTPKEILEIPSLEELTLAVNPIQEFPCDLYKLKRLKIVSFAETSIREINCDLSRLDSIEEFDLARNELTKLPEQVKNLPRLTWLSLNDNQFADLSFADKRLNKLECLYLYSNKVKTISKETRYLPHLKELLIFDNAIDSIPSNIADLKSLEKLEIWDNPVKYISPNIAHLTKLRSLRMDDDFLAQADKDNLKKWLPNCDIHFQTRNEKKR